ncbi:hypothetical protein SCLCIDRAFT_1217055 [Scleroderma citrinum Foug A]|uniref:UBC core domain-containing protein n=1 Tax=Scleroderma citrinum Foug A TaxID=1036808 RepID=A0A0C2ZEW4_9AGAM|nr:hypothetical protein SCLCIDRAFT_1217055 [Scleroderma citrinum Foug A]
MEENQPIDASISWTTPYSSRPLKGRKKFSADLSNLQMDTEITGRTGRWSVKNVGPGEEEGTFVFDLVESDTEIKDTINILVSDTSEYPSYHSFFGCSRSGESTPQIAEIIEKLPERRACSVRDVVDFFLVELSHEDEDCDVSSGSCDHQLDDEQFFTAFTEPGPSPESQLHLNYLKRDFVETSDAGYNPGIIWRSSDDFLLTVSLPVIGLIAKIPSHALLAWDRRFLEPGQNLVLLISGFRCFYPILREDGTLVPEASWAGAGLKFKLGLSPNYKPSSGEAKAAFRHFDVSCAAKGGESSDPDQQQSALVDNKSSACAGSTGVFRRTSLSSSLESLLDKYLVRLIQLRKKFNLGWASAEELLWKSETAQDDPANVFSVNKEMLSNVEKEEKALSASYHLPSDPIVSGSSHVNIIKTAFAFVLRRLALCTRHCAVCHKKLHNEYEALKPYVCNSQLCIFQYYSLNFGPSLEHEICTNSETVDLLVSLAYIAAAEGTLDEPFPRGMGLRVPRAAQSTSGADGGDFCDFDALTVKDMRMWITILLDTLPSIETMKSYLLRNPKAKLQDINPGILPAAWSVLKWCVASCTSHIQELKDHEDFLGNIGNEFRQFRFVTGSPDKEAKFKTALEKQLPPNPKYPTIFAFHGSPVNNWHSIIRHGLWYKKILHGRACGNGVYCARDGTQSSSYALRNTAKWRGSSLMPSRCLTLVEIVNLPSRFVCTNPYVVDNTDWIMCRYLLVESGDYTDSYDDNNRLVPVNGNFLVQDPQRKALFGNAPVGIPKPSHHFDKLLKACEQAQSSAQYDEEDMAIFDVPYELQGIDALDSPMTPSSPSREKWTSDNDWVEKNVQILLPPPTESSMTATMALQREFRAMYREQQKAKKKDEMELLGWYMPPEFNENNLYQWVIEMHSFDPELPLARDMKEKGVTSLVFEIRFPHSFPHSPPFFRIIRPRFLTFMEGGGGHVTVGGSICMDLLTSEGWLPSYNIPAILLQIKLAISSTDPWPARLHPVNWNKPYTPTEALNGYTRAAALHNWKVLNVAEIKTLVTRH